MPLFSLNPPHPDFSRELRLKNHDCHAIAGIDEAGRGPLAGPVVASAVILDHNKLPSGIDDSKRLSPQKREQLFVEIMRCAVAVSVASLCATAIDAANIRQATLEVMRRAVAALAIQPDYALIDGRDIPPRLPCSAEALVKGDQLSLSIAAASIIAKVTRDRMMRQAGNAFPFYGFDHHAGYGTAAHRLSLERHGGVAKLHRFSFAPLKKR